MKTALIDGQNIDRFIPAHLRDMFHKHAMPEYKYAAHDGYAPYGFSTEGLVLYLPLWALRDDPFPSVDAYKHICTVTGALWTPQGRTFDGDDEIDCGNASSLDLTTALTIEVWLKPDNQNDCSFIAKFNNVPGEKQFLFQQDTLKARMLLRKGDDSGYITTTSSNSEIDAGAWQHWTTTWDATTLKYYKNAVADGTPAAVGTLPSTVAPLNIGRYPGSAQYYEGVKGEVRIYNRALVLAEIAYNRNCTKWRFPQ